MQSADDFIAHIGEFNPSAMQEKYRNKPSITINEAWRMIDEARKEAIKHCASKITYPVYDFNGNLCNDRVKKIILKQIEELK